MITIQDNFLAQDTIDTIATEIKRCIQNFEKRVVVEDVEVYPEVDQNAFRCKIFFHVRGITNIQELGIVLERVR